MSDAALIQKIQLALPTSPTGYEEITIAAVAIGPTSSQIEASNYAIILFTGGPIRFRDDGTNPTSAIGYPQFDGDTIALSVASLRKVKFIRIGAINGVARLRYYR